MTLSAIVATDLHNGIGKNNQLLWHLPADLKFFKSTTMGCPVIMGRKTYQSIGRLLPGRQNFIVTRNTEFKIEGAVMVNSVKLALEQCMNEKVFIIGGAEIYNQTLSDCEEVYRTLVQAAFEADTYFPDLIKAGFKMIWEECHTADEKNKYDYCFQKWVKA